MATKVQKKRQPRPPTARAKPPPAWSSPTRARGYLLKRHAVDPDTDPLVGLALNAATTAKYLEQYQDVVSWWRKIRAQYEDRPPMPTLHGATPNSPRHLGNEFRSNLEQTCTRFFAAADALLAAGEQMEVQERGLEEGVVLHSRADSKGGRPQHVADLAFAFTLDYLWQHSKRKRLNATDVACMACLFPIGASVGDPGKKWRGVLRRARELPFDPSDHESVTPANVEVYLMLRSPPRSLCAKKLVAHLLRRKTKG